MGPKLSGKTVLITGASAGIGWASAVALAGEGANLVVTARRDERLAELKAAIQKAGGKAISLVGDAKEEETARRAVDLAIQTFGSLDILINNVGIGNYKNLIDTSAEEYDEMMDSNVRSTFLFTRHAVPVMIKQGSGTILMISSMAGVYGFGGEVRLLRDQIRTGRVRTGLGQRTAPTRNQSGGDLPGRSQDRVCAGQRQDRGGRGGIWDARSGRRGRSRSDGVYPVAGFSDHRSADAHNGRGIDITFN